MCDNKMDGEYKALILGLLIAAFVLISLMASITTYNSLYNHNKLLETQDCIGYEQGLEPSNSICFMVWKQKQIDSFSYSNEE